MSIETNTILFFLFLVMIWPCKNASLLKALCFAFHLRKDRCGFTCEIMFSVTQDSQRGSLQVVCKCLQGNLCISPAVTTAKTEVCATRGLVKMATHSQASALKSVAEEAKFYVFLSRRFQTVECTSAKFKLTLESLSVKDKSLLETVLQFFQQLMARQHQKQLSQPRHQVMYIMQCKAFPVTSRCSKLSNLQGSSQRSQGVAGRYALTVDVPVPLRLQKRRYAFDVFILLVFSFVRESIASGSQVHETRRAK